MNHVEQLKALDACPEAVDWAATQPDWATCWANCPSGEWMLWALEKAGTTERELAEARCDLVDTVLHLVPEGEERPRIANEVRRAWGRGEATDEELARASVAASVAAEAVAASVVAWAVAWAAAAASASVAASVAAWAARVAATETTNLEHTAIVRKHFPAAPALGEVTL